MLQDFFVDFKATHESLRARAAADLDVMERAAAALRTAPGLGDALEGFDRHVAQRKKQLA
jgi:hypothetical protein